MNATARLNLIYWVLLGLVAIPVSVIYWQHTDPMGAARYYDFEQCYYATARDVFYRGDSALRPHFADGSFMNVPFAAWVIAPVGGLDRLSADLVFASVSIASVLATIVLLSRYGHSKTAPGLCLLFLLNGPLWYGLLVGNSTQIVLLCLVAALTLWRRQNAYTAGFLIGFAAVIKPMLILFGLYFIIKRDWRVVAGGATVIIGSLAGSIAVAGFDITLYWYQHTLAAFAGRPMPAYNVQSIEAFILRLSESPSSVANFYPHTLSLWEKVIRDIVFLALFSLVGFGLWLGRARSMSLPRQQPGPREYLEYSLVLTLCVITSTVSWTHYYLLLLLPYALYFTGNLPLQKDRLTQCLMWMSLIFCSLPVHRHVFASPALESFFFKSFQSIWLFGGLLLFWALTRGALSSAAVFKRSPHALAVRV